jgi:hypothetical protein
VIYEGYTQVNELKMGEGRSFRRRINLQMPHGGEIQCERNKQTN